MVYQTKSCNKCSNIESRPPYSGRQWTAECRSRYTSKLRLARHKTAISSLLLNVHNLPLLYIARDDIGSVNDSPYISGDLRTSQHG